MWPLQVTKGNQAHAFYTLPEYERWAEGVNTSGWKIKYYKGLGTSTNQEAREYFADIDRHRKTFAWTGGPRSQALQPPCQEHTRRNPKRNTVIARDVSVDNTPALHAMLPHN